MGGQVGVSVGFLHGQIFWLLFTSRILFSFFSFRVIFSFPSLFVQCVWLQGSFVLLVWSNAASSLNLFSSGSRAWLSAILSFIARKNKIKAVAFFCACCVHCTPRAVQHGVFGGAPGFLLFFARPFSGTVFSPYGRSWPRRLFTPLLFYFLVPYS
jgi:hypothetical protein